LQDWDLSMKSYSNDFKVQGQRDIHGKPGCLCADPDEMRRWIEYLALEIGPRPYSSPKLLRKVADRLSESFKSLGYNVDEQLYYYKGEIYYNICASPKTEKIEQGSVPLLVVGAHYDTVSCSPGADDNASGIAGIMELARLISRDPPPGGWLPLPLRNHLSSEHDIWGVLFMPAALRVVRPL